MKSMTDRKRRSISLVIAIIVILIATLACGPVNDLVQKRIRETQAAWTAVPTLEPCECSGGEASLEPLPTYTPYPPYPTYTLYPTFTPFPPNFPNYP
jgi:hypothetical protein